MISKPTTRVVPEDAGESDWERACELADDYGLPTDPWQKELIHDIISERPNGLYSAPVFGFSLPRRNGKSHIVRVLSLYFMVILDREVVYTSHRTQSSKEIWKEMKTLFEETDLSSHVKKISNVTGHEGIYLNDGGAFRIFSRSEGKGSGRGSPADVLFLDEAYNLPESTLADLLPMVTNAENPLTVYLGSPSYEDSAGAAFKQIRQSAISGHSPRGGWVEWAAPEGADVFAPETWRMTNPAMSSGRITEETMSNNVYSGMSRRQILVELMGSWEAENRPLVVDIEKWAKMHDPASTIAPDSPLVLAADAAPDESSGALVVCGFTPPDASGNVRKHVEVIEHLSGIRWLEESIKERCRKRTFSAVLIDSKAPIAYMKESLEKAGVPVVLTGYEFMASSAVYFKQGVDAVSFRHKGDGRLARAIRGAANRPLNGKQAFAKAEPDSDITPLVAASLALYGQDSDAITSKVKKQRTGKVFAGGKLYERKS